MKNRIEQRRLRHRRLRQKVQGTAARPRMALYFSNKNINVQFIDDDAAKTIAAATTLGTDAKLNVATATELGKKAAEAAIAKGVSKVVVDRGGYAFHGRVKALVEAAVAAGLKISDKEPAKEAK
ncbi:MAG: 50S ribosomal protein L18 [Kiritimatiellae bacterium]|jgi:large subunit ribosomal protein L18|nr:50S ribosomal protein L18 [Kiritimatiellia bacterium]